MRISLQPFVCFCPKSAGRSVMCANPFISIESICRGFLWEEAAEIYMTYISPFFIATLLFYIQMVKIRRTLSLSLRKMLRLRHLGSRISLLWAITSRTSRSTCSTAGIPYRATPHS